MGNVVEFAKGAWKDAADAVRTAEEALKVGAVAGGLSMGILFPLDVKKTLRQASTATSSKALLAVERGQKNPFAGLLPGLMAQLPAAVLTFGAYSAIVNWIQKRQENPINRVQVVMAACLSDAIGSLWVTPLEILKQRVQNGQYPNVLSALGGMLGDRGLVGAYQGFFSVVARDVGYRALHLVLFDELRKRANRQLGRNLNLQENIGLSTAVAAVAAIITTPLDLVKTRLMTQNTGCGRIYVWFGEAIMHIAKQESKRGLFRGYAQRVGYAAGTSLLFLLAYDRVAEKMGASSKAFTANGDFSKSTAISNVIVSRKSKSNENPSKTAFISSAIIPRKGTH